MDGETAVADEDDVAAGQPAAKLDRPLAGPVSQQLVPAATLEAAFSICATVSITSLSIQYIGVEPIIKLLG
jgi:hypothetical protein